MIFLFYFDKLAGFFAKNAAEQPCQDSNTWSQWRRLFCFNWSDGQDVGPMPHAKTLFFLAS